MAHHAPVDDDPQQLQAARNFWAAFTQGTKWSVIIIALVLIIMALLFVPTGA